MLNETLANQLQNPLNRERDLRNKARILESFPVLGAGSEHHSLVLLRYLDNCPERFFDRSAYETYLMWFQVHDKVRPRQLKKYFSDCDSDFNRALLFLRELNVETWHDGPLRDGDDYDLMRMIEKHVHPAYLRLVEGVFAPLLRPLAYFSRIDRNKGVEGLTVHSIIDELKGQNEAHLTENYVHIIRNGIAHGDISYLQRRIRYRDQKGNEETFDTSYVIRLFDDLLDTCNGLAAAFKSFLLSSHSLGYMSPRELMVEALQELTWAPWWAIEGCVEAEIADRSQLTVFARPDSRGKSKVIWSTVQSGILSESLAPGFDRYFFSLHSRKALPGWAAFDGRRLRALRERGADALSKYQGILEDNLFSYEPRPTMPALLAKVDTYATSIRINLPIAVRKLRDSLGIPTMFFRVATLHRNSWGAVLWGSVVLEGVADQELVGVIRDNCGRIVKKGKRNARRTSGFNFAGLLPIGYAQINVFRRDYRRRRLSSFGLGDDLVCTVRLQRINRIKAPDIFGSTIETRGKWRIAWNKAWLDSVGNQVLDC